MFIIIFLTKHQILILTTILTVYQCLFLITTHFDQNLNFRPNLYFYQYFDLKKWCFWFWPVFRLLNKKYQILTKVLILTNISTFPRKYLILTKILILTNISSFEQKYLIFTKVLILTNISTFEQKYLILTEV